MSELDHDVRISFTTHVDGLSVFDEAAQPFDGPTGTAEFVRSTWGGIIDLPTEPLPQLRNYSPIDLQGLPYSVAVRGHIVETSDPITIRIFRSERGQWVCAGAFDRRHVLGVIEVAPPSAINGTVSVEQPVETRK
jgi:hypothetical protein